jgi:hypothetical protein
MEVFGMEHGEFSKEELLRRVHTGRQELESTLARINESRMSAKELHDGWSVKDMLAHLGWWEHRIARIFDALIQGRDPDPRADDEELDDLNTRVYNEWRDRSLEEVRSYEREGYEKVVSLVERAAHEDLFDPHRFSWTEGEPFFGWIVGNTFGHYEEHLGFIREWLEREGVRET